MSVDEIRGKSLRELEQMLKSKMDDVYLLRREIDRRKGDVPPSKEVDFEKYVTK